MLKTDNRPQPGTSTRGSSNRAFEARNLTVGLSINPEFITAASLPNKNLKEKVQEKPVKYLCRAVTAGLVILLLGFGLYIGFKAFKRKKVPDNKHTNASSTPYTPLLRAPQPEEQGEKCDDELCQQLYYLLGPIGMLCITLVIQYVDKISGYKLSSTIGRRIRRSPKIEDLEEDSPPSNLSGATEQPATELSLNPPSTSAAQELVQPRLEFKNQSTNL